jgi:hypothetical protein
VSTRCFIGFFGLTRSLRQTVGSIRVGFLEPLANAGLETIRAGHFNLPKLIDNPRSEEFGIEPDRHEAALLDLELCWVQAQDDARIAQQIAIATRYPDGFGDRGRSLANLCHQLHSLACVWSLLDTLGVEPDDLVLLLRPDLLYLDTLDVEAHLRQLLDGRADLIVPGWQSWGGLNDRFAFCTGRGARVYASRIDEFESGCAAIGAMHSERFLALTAARHGLRVATTGFRAVRLRANGKIPQNDMSLLDAFVRTATAAE